MRLGVGLLGAGWMGEALLARFVERDDVEVRGLCQRNSDTARATLKAHGLDDSLWTADAQQILDDPSIGAVVVCTPNALHGAQAIAALEAGKHVFCEKPAATRFDEWFRQIELATARPDQVTFVDYILAFDAMERRLRAMVDSGSFGTIKQIQVNYRHPVNIAGDKAWKLRADVIGDAVGMGIIHALWAMLHAMESQARPVAVFAHSAPARSRPFEVDPIWTIQVRFDNGATGICLGDIDSGVGYDAYHHLSGTDGAFVFDSLAERERQIRYRSHEVGDGTHWVWPLDAARCASEGVGERAWDAGTDTPSSGDVWKHQTAAAVAHFVECIHDQRPSPLSFEATRSVAEVGWAALWSAATGREIELPLDVESARAFFAG